eukprot:GHVN01023865.1.p1 GENE.GHVN01023865.1~~GHVN01023865.1.p1  ORF type:complete len:328 (+),score=23.36 GHVN01023865.1:789-1772(+)
MQAVKGLLSAIQCDVKVVAAWKIGEAEASDRGDQRPPLVKVICASDSDAQLVLSFASQLRGIPAYSAVYVQPDLTAVQLKEHRALLSLRAKKIAQDGEGSWVLRGRPGSAQLVRSDVGDPPPGSSPSVSGRRRGKPSSSSRGGLKRRRRRSEAELLELSPSSSFRVPEPITTDHSDPVHPVHDEPPLVINPIIQQSHSQDTLCSVMCGSRPRVLRCGTLNVRFIRYKLHEVSILLSHFCLDLLVLTESSLLPSVPLPLPPCYCVAARCDRQTTIDGRGGGVLIFIRDYLRFTQLPTTNTLGVAIHVNRFLIWGVYVPPSSTWSERYW